MKYLAVLEHDGQAHGGLIPELNVMVVGKTQEQVRERLEQGIAIAALEYQRAGRPLPPAVYASADDLPAEFLADFSQPSIELLEAAPINPVSLEIERALEASGLSDSAVAREMDSSPAAIGRLRNYFYWGHSLPTLRKLAAVLGMADPVLTLAPKATLTREQDEYHGLAAPMRGPATIGLRRTPELETMTLPAIIRLDDDYLRLTKRLGGTSETLDFETHRLRPRAR